MQSHTHFAATCSTALCCAADGGDVQSALQEVTGSHTVPQIFIKGQFLGGASETQDAYHSGDLMTKLDDAGVSHK